MKKPINKFALLTWIASACLACATIGLEAYALFFVPELSIDRHTQSLALLAARLSVAMITPITSLVAFGGLIEIVDRIRVALEVQKTDGTLL